MIDRAEPVLFWVFALPLIVSAAGVVAAANPVSSAICLVTAFCFLAGIYVLLTAHLLAFLQIMVYAGAIMVLFLFVIMLLNTGDDALGRARMKIMQAAGVVGAAGVVAVVVMAVNRAGALPMTNVRDDFGTVKEVGRLLYTQYLLPFEVTSLLLLVAIVGAVVVAKARI